jgi:high-affinity nickel permease
MKLTVSVFCFLLSALLNSCVAYKGQGVYFGAVGTDADEVTVEPLRFQVRGMNNSRAFDRAAQMVEKMWDAYMMLQGFTFVTGRYYDHEGKIVDSARSVKLQELRNAASEAEAASKIKELELLKSSGA